MSSLSTPVRQYWAALRVVLVLTVVLGILYPLAVLAVGQLAFHAKANGSLVKSGGQVVGSSLLGQSFTDDKGNPLPQWFQPRPSAAGTGYDPTLSGASNLGPENEDLVKAIQDRRQAVAEFDGVDPSTVPPDAITASGSGLDPDISPTYAYEQVQRVARARGLDPAAVRSLVEAQVKGRDLGILGEQTVNVLDLNLALQKLGS
ncbi:MAG: potassium-transporting ATPase subunit KdpC [Nocardioidaceae bacterium]